MINALAADIHLTDRDRGNSYYALSQIVDYCLTHPTRALFLLGDIVDRMNPGPAVVRELNRQVDRLRAGGVRLRYILGNHDMGHDWPQTHSWPEHIHRESFGLGSHLAYALDWTPAGRLAAELAEVPPGVDIFLGHQVWEEMRQHMSAAEGSLVDVPHARCVISGDFHAPVALNISRHDGTHLVAISPGSTCLQAVDEAPDKSFLVPGPRFEDDPSDWVRVPLLSRPVLTVNLTETSAWTVDTVRALVEELRAEAEAAGLPQGVSEPRLAIYGRPDDPSAAKIFRACQDVSWATFRPVAGEVAHQTRDELKLAAKNTLRAALQSKLTPAAWGLASELLGNPEAKRRIEELRADYFAAHGVAAP